MLDAYVCRILEKSAPSSTGCFISYGTKNIRGRAVIRVKGQTINSARVILMYKLGRNLRTKEFACHTCDNPACVNPTHVYLGSVQTNAHDRVLRSNKVTTRPETRERVDRVRNYLQTLEKDVCWK